MKYLLRKFFKILLMALLFGTGSRADNIKGAGTLSLNGQWQMGFSRKYTSKVQVPGIATNPAKMSDEVLWYRKEIKLPVGTWQTATLELKGARFLPQVYVNGQLAGERPGGMAPVFFELNSKEIHPGGIITLEIALASLKNVPPTDASQIPGSDHWRSNVSSGLWDDVVLHLHGQVSINRVIPFINKDLQKVSVQFDLNNAQSFTGKASLQIIDAAGKVLITQLQRFKGSHSTVDFNCNGKLQSWSVDIPTLYKLKLTVADNAGGITDETTQSFGLKSFEVKQKQFYLNGRHIVPKGVTVVWHRWVRSTEGRDLGYDTSWFRKNIIQMSKDHGANYLRFHLGKPPERFLDMCDKYGLIVQYEWSFFHGMPASKESLVTQYKNWLDLAMRHPSVNLIHPYNETGGDQLKTVWAALDELLPAYPPLVLEDRDVMHIHKYWWSMFENIGLYYDDANIFPKAIIADEFGGNYLDEKGNLGGYPSLKESFLRFLGRKNTVSERLFFHAQSNARIAEYWRRIGAAGYAPFCALGSYEDGNTWFLGLLKDAKPMPVWDALTASFSPRSVSINLWDKDFEPDQNLSLSLYLFNDEAAKANLSVKLSIEDKVGKALFTKLITVSVDAYSKKVISVPVNMPSQSGDYVVKAALINKPAAIKYPVISEWDIRVVKAIVPLNIKKIKVAVPQNETELRQFLKNNNIAVVDTGDNSADAVLTSVKAWNNLAKGDLQLSNTLKTAVTKGKAVIMLDVGDRQLGQGYPTRAGDLGPLQGVARITNPKVNTYQVFGGISLKFTETAEPESYIHPDRANRELWGDLPDEYTWIWNGLRGGLIVPAADMEFSGLSANAFIVQWKARGAAEDKIKTGPYYAYELQGFYDFSDKPNDAETQKKLKDKVHFLVQDAPALANAINLLTPVAITDLNQAYRNSEKGIADNFIPMANCAKNLTQTPVAFIDFGKQKGTLLVSQLLTSGRLAKGFGEEGLYGIRYDVVTAQIVLNMIGSSVNKVLLNK